MTIGEGWADGAWVDAGWATGAWVDAEGIVGLAIYSPWIWDLYIPKYRR